MLGSTEPRIWTPPLRELTEETSLGFAVIKFATDVLLLVFPGGSRVARRGALPVRRWPR